MIIPRRLSMEHPNIFDYENYRVFLKDFYQKKKQEKATYSFQVFAWSLGFKSKSFLAHVINGERGLSPQSTYKISQALDFSIQENMYFETLVSIEKSKTDKQKEYYRNRLKRILSSIKEQVDLLPKTTDI